MTSCNGSSVSVDHDLECFGAISVSNQPDRHKNVLEGLPSELRIHLKITLRVARNFCGTKRVRFSLHRLTRVLRGRNQIDLILFDDPPREKTRIVWF